MIGKQNSKESMSPCCLWDGVSFFEMPVAFLVSVFFFKVCYILDGPDSTSDCACYNPHQLLGDKFRWPAFVHCQQSQQSSPLASAPFLFFL